MSEQTFYPYSIPRQTKYDSSFVFRTAEEFETVEQKLAAHYFRPNDPFCVAVLEFGKTSSCMHAVSKAFPFFRLASVLQIPTGEGAFSDWLVSAFYAGYHYGSHFPNQAEEIVERAFGGHNFSHKRLIIVNEVLNKHPATMRNLMEAFRIIAQNSSRDLSQPFQEHLIYNSLKSVVVGFAAATTGKCDPVLVDFLDELAADFDVTEMPHIFRVMARSLTEAEGKPLKDLLQHPLLTVAEAQYLATPVERKTILPFFHKELDVFGVQSGSECPTSDGNLVAWIDAGLDFGKSVLEDRPLLVDEMCREITSEKLTQLKVTALSFSAAAKGLDPTGLVEPISNWHEEIYGWRVPAFYGFALERAMHFADFAAWLPWLLEFKAAKTNSGQ
jgi:hypothetical protein